MYIYQFGLWFWCVLVVERGSNSSSQCLVLLTGPAELVYTHHTLARNTLTCWLAVEAAPCPAAVTRVIGEGVIGRRGRGWRRDGVDYLPLRQPSLEPLPHPLPGRRFSGIWTLNKGSASIHKRVAR